MPFFGGLTALQPRQFEGASNVTILSVVAFICSVLVVQVIDIPKRGARHLDGNRITTLVDHAFFGLTNLTNLCVARTSCFLGLYLTGWDRFAGLST